MPEDLIQELYEGIAAMAEGGEWLVQDDRAVAYVKADGIEVVSYDAEEDGDSELGQSKSLPVISITVCGEDGEEQEFLVTITEEKR
ncbi:MAG: hypothetical protein ACRD6W_11620 [Nitrososphaerales archaeon]